MHVTMATEKKNINIRIKALPRNNNECVVYVNTEKKKLKEHNSLKVTSVLAYITSCKSIYIKKKGYLKWLLYGNQVVNQK